MKQSIKVAYFVAEYHRFSGGQKSLLTMIKYLPQDIIEPLVIFPAEGKCSQIYRESKIKVYIIKAPPELNVFNKVLLNLSLWQQGALFITKIIPYNLKLYSFIKEKEIDILHFNTPRALLMGFIAPKMLDKSTILHVRGGLDLLGDRLKFFSCVVCTKMILVSSYLLKSIDSKFHNKCITLHNPIEPRDIRPKLSQKTKLNQRLVFLTPASLVPFKGYHHLLESIAILKKRGVQDVEFIGIGETTDKEYKNFIEDLKFKLKIDNFVHLGWQKDPFLYYEKADVVLLPSIEKERLEIGGKDRVIIGSEGFPRALLEAIALGKPIIASNIAGIPELVKHNINGYLVSPGSAEDLAEKIQRLVLSPDKRKEMSKESVKISRLFYPQNIVPKIVELYKTLVYPARFD
jgi:glycosyltransferase involved in cell wall biosynthesis